MPEQAQTLDTWAIVEVMGHKKFAGYTTEQAFGAAALIRVDVPETTQPGDRQTKPYTKLIGVGSIYCITPCTEEIARAAATRLEMYNDPIPVDLPTRALAAGAPASDAELVDDDEVDDDVYEDDFREINRR